MQDQHDNQQPMAPDIDKLEAEKKSINQVFTQPIHFLSI